MKRRSEHNAPPGPGEDVTRAVDALPALSGVKLTQRTADAVRLRLERHNPGFGVLFDVMLDGLVQSAASELEPADDTAEPQVFVISRGQLVGFAARVATMATATTAVATGETLADARVFQEQFDVRLPDDVKIHPSEADPTID